MFNMFSSFGFPPAVDGVDYLSPEDAKKGMDTGQFKAVVDVRTPGEYYTAHIPESELAPVMNVNGLLDKLEQYKNEEILLYCNTKNSSSMAAKVLATAGFKNLAVLDGGISEWSKRGYPIEN
ncbi:hypothetical protein MNBD_NITROSPINAE04-1470 [hydrothermal vent metagenome]|uniref:Rhodanese domain-containing protein n=1 Tax=hydrothermal vent metagenome TaxID=652676 RepID=A0A3B1D1V5_9ZZZZ